MKRIRNPRYDTLCSSLMVIGGPSIRGPKTRCRKLYQLILEYEEIEKVHKSEYEVFENIDTVRRQNLVIILSR